MSSMPPPPPPGGYVPQPGVAPPPPTLAPATFAPAPPPTFVPAGVQPAPPSSKQPKKVLWLVLGLLGLAIVGGAIAVMSQSGSNNEADDTGAITTTVGSSTSSGAAVSRVNTPVQVRAIEQIIDRKLPANDVECVRSTPFTLTYLDGTTIRCLSIDEDRNAYVIEAVKRANLGSDEFSVCYAKALGTVAIQKAMQAAQNDSDANKIFTDAGTSCR